jgi:hypothetical protein
VLSSPDRDDDLLQERLRALHDRWPGDPGDADPLRDARRRARDERNDGGDDGALPGASGPCLAERLRRACRAIGRRLGASATGLLLPETPADPHGRAPLTRSSPSDHPGESSMGPPK